MYCNNILKLFLDFKNLKFGQVITNSQPENQDSSFLSQPLYRANSLSIVRFQSTLLPSVLMFRKDRMGDTTLEIADQRQALEDAYALELVHASFLVADDSQKSVDTLSADVDIQAGFDEIRQLKTQLVAVRSLELFLQQIRLDNTIETVATAKESASEDFSLREAKESLRSVKKVRVETDKRLPDVVQDIVTNLRRRDAVAGQIRRHIRQQRAAERAREVQHALETRDLNAIERLVDHIDEVDRPSCVDMIHLVREEKKAANKDATQIRAQVEAERRDVEELEETVNIRDEHMRDLNRRIAAVDSVIECAPELRHTISLERRLGMALHALTGITVWDVHEGGLSLAVDAHIFSNIMRKKAQGHSSHTLTFKFTAPNNCSTTEDCSEVSDVFLDSRDEDLSISSDVCGSPFLWAARDLLSTLRIYTEQKY